MRLAYGLALVLSLVALAASGYCLYHCFVADSEVFDAGNSSDGWLGPEWKRWLWIVVLVASVVGGFFGSAVHTRESGSYGRGGEQPAAQLREAETTRIRLPFYHYVRSVYVAVDESRSGTRVSQSVRVPWILLLGLGGYWYLGPGGRSEHPISTDEEDGNERPG